MKEKILSTIALITVFVPLTISVSLERKALIDLN